MSGNGMMSFFPTNFMLQQSSHHHHDDDLHPILPSSPPQHFHVSTLGASFTGKRSMSYSGIDHICEETTTTNIEEEVSDDGSQSGEKKRRLNIEQVKTLEKNFELGNKLDPERKMQLSRALGLQPRQIAIWFQNRRARWKTKQLEKDYDDLKRKFDLVKADNDLLQAENQQLHAEIMALKGREQTESINLNKETEGSSSIRSENSSDDINNLDISRTPPPIGIGMTQLFHQSSSNPNHHHHNHNHGNNHSHNQNHQSVKEESFTNIFCGGEDQSGLWPWLEQTPF